MNSDQRDTREKLLDAAERLFAEDGFDGVPIRDIAAAADVNIAAVNYHFQGKDRLYFEVLRRSITTKRDRNLAALDAVLDEVGNDLEAIVRAFFRSHLDDALKTEAGRNFLRLLVREMHHGSPEGSLLIQELMLPMWDRLGQALLECLPDADPASAPWIVGSLHGNLIHFTMRWHSIHADSCGQGVPETMRSLFPPLAEDVDEYIDLAVDHITRFSVAGIRAVVAHDASSGPQPVEETS